MKALTITTMSAILLALGALSGCATTGTTTNSEGAQSDIPDQRDCTGSRMCG